MIETVTIPKNEYEQLVRDSQILSALEVGGVDNWEYYGEALEQAGLLDDDDD